MMIFFFFFFLKIGGQLVSYSLRDFGIITKLKCDKDTNYKHQVNSERSRFAKTHFHSPINWEEITRSFCFHMWVLVMMKMQWNFHRVTIATFVDCHHNGDMTSLTLLMNMLKTLKECLFLLRFKCLNMKIHLND